MLKKEISSQLLVPTGRSTGPHLDVRLNWFGTRLDPATILNIQ